MPKMYFDTCYNKFITLSTNANLFMDDVLTCQLTGLGVTTKPMPTYGMEITLM